MIDPHPKDFDHSEFATMPEYHRLREALSEFLNAAQEQGGATIEVIADMTRSAYAGDYCPCCKIGDEVPSPTCWPFKASVKGDWMTGAYRCPRTGMLWKCGYTADLREIAAMP